MDIKDQKQPLIKPSPIYIYERIYMMRQGYRYIYALSIFLGLSVASAFIPPSQQQQRWRSTFFASTSKTTTVLHMNSADNAASDDDSNALNKWSRYVYLH